MHDGESIRGFDSRPRLMSGFSIWVAPPLIRTRRPRLDKNWGSHRAKKERRYRCRERTRYVRIWSTGLDAHKGFFDANIPGPGIVLLVMNDRSHSPHGKINLHGNGLGVPSPELVEKRAREIAMIDERDPNEFTETDWHQAKNELTGVGASHVPEEVDEDVDDERSERDEVPGASGHRAPRSGFDGRGKCRRGTRQRRHRGSGA